MFTKAIKLAAVAFGFAMGGAQATVTLAFSSSYDTGIASGFSTRLGSTGVDGLRWGIIVDTAGDGFANSGSAYDNIVGGPTTAGFLNIDDAVATNDYFIPATSLTQDFSAFQEGDFSTPGGHGTIDTIADIVYANGVGLNDKFALIWFDSTTANDGDYYGFFTHNSFVLPPDGTALDSSFAAAFTGVDPVRNASNQFAAIPEPSRMLLLGMAMFGLIFRRRR